MRWVKGICVRCQRPGLVPDPVLHPYEIWDCKKCRAVYKRLGDRVRKRRLVKEAKALLRSRQNEYQTKETTDNVGSKFPR